MNRMQKTALAIFPAMVLGMTPLACPAAAESGTLGDVYTWEMVDDVLTLHAADGSFDIICQGEEYRLTGEVYDAEPLPLEKTEENAAVLEFLENYAPSVYYFDVQEIQSPVALFGSTNIELVTFSENVQYAAPDTLAELADAATIVVRSDVLSLSGTQIGTTVVPDALYGVVLGHAGSPAEAYAQELGFGFGALEGSGTQEQYAWTVENDVLTISANDGSFEVQYLPEEIKVTGTAYTMDTNLGSLVQDGNSLSVISGFMMQYHASKLIFDVEEIAVSNTGICHDEITKIRLTDKVKTICPNGLSGFTHLKDIYVRNPELSLEKSGLSGTVTIHGYTGSPAEAYAREHDMAFVSLNSTSETTAASGTETTATEMTTSGKTTTTTTATGSGKSGHSVGNRNHQIPSQVFDYEDNDAEETLPSVDDSSTATSADEITEDSITVMTTAVAAAQVSADPGAAPSMSTISALSAGIPVTGDKGVIAMSLAGLVALIGGLITRRRK